MTSKRNPLKPELVQQLDRGLAKLHTDRANGDLRPDRADQVIRSINGKGGLLQKPQIASIRLGLRHLSDIQMNSKGILFGTNEGHVWEVTVFGAKRLVEKDETLANQSDSRITFFKILPDDSFVWSEEAHHAFTGQPAVVVWHPAPGKNIRPLRREIDRGSGREFCRASVQVRFSPARGEYDTDDVEVFVPVYQPGAIILKKIRRIDKVTFSIDDNGRGRTHLNPIQGFKNTHWMGLVGNEPLLLDRRKHKTGVRYTLYWDQFLVAGEVLEQSICYEGTTLKFVARHKNGYTLWTKGRNGHFIPRRLKHLSKNKKYCFWACGGRIWIGVFGGSSGFSSLHDVETRHGSGLDDPIFNGGEGIKVKGGWVLRLTIDREDALVFWPTDKEGNPDGGMSKQMVFSTGRLHNRKLPMISLEETLTLEDGSTVVQGAAVDSRDHHALYQIKDGQVYGLYKIPKVSFNDGIHYDRSRQQLVAWVIDSGQISIYTWSMRKFML